MSEEEVFKMDEEIKQEPEKPKKKKKELSPERKEALKLQLAKAREISIKNRKKRALEKKIDKQEAEKARDQKIAKSVLGQHPHEEKINS